ncbi:glycosyltransferase [Streptomyces sp. NPDC056061]|uniref:glycosyltransferase n=1 Tax=Streptomyces sp. NPDC056061 TaxID=3345700 RepID=UPI0035D9B054
MSGVLICSSPAEGHVTPLLAVARGLVAAGHRVVLLTGRRFADRVRATGADFAPLPQAVDFDDTWAESHPERAGKRGLAAMRFDLDHMFFRAAEPQYETVTALIDAHGIDVVLAEPLFLGAAPLALLPRDRRPRLMLAGIVPLPLTGPDVAPFGLGLPPRGGLLGRLRNRALTVLTRRVVFPAQQRDLSQLCRRITGRPLPGLFLDWPALADDLVQLTVPDFEYPRPRAIAPVHFIGPLGRSSTSDHPLPDWWTELDGDRPVVLVTQGTAANTDFDELINPAVAALAGEDVTVVVATCGRGTAAWEAGLPGNARAASFLPYDELLPRTALMITNGGYGGVHFALRHGVPLVVAGATEDKAEVAARVTWSGAGIGLRTNRPSARTLGAAARRVLAEPAYRHRAGALAEQIAAAGGIDALVDLIGTGRTA